jgi:excinuclease ABC subunit B
MYQHARDLEFEDAARVRDEIRKIREATLAG